MRERVAGLWTRRGLVKDSESVDEKDMMLEARSMRRRRRDAYKVWKSEQRQTRYVSTEPSAAVAVGTWEGGRGEGGEQLHGKGSRLSIPRAEKTAHEPWGNLPTMLRGSLRSKVRRLFAMLVRESRQSYGIHAAMSIDDCWPEEHKEYEP